MARRTGQTRGLDTKARSPRLHQPFRALEAALKVLERSGVGPSPDKLLALPVDQRKLFKQPFFARKPGDRTLVVYETRVNERVGVRVYTRGSTLPGSPAILYIHGGGFVAGGPDDCDYITRGLASRTGFPVISVDYRLAPECPFPGALEDCADALEWVVETRPEGIDPDRIAIAGDSAGGNLTAALAIKTRDSNGPKIAHQTLIYPFTDGTLSSPDHDLHRRAFVDRATAQRMVQLYAPNHPADEPLVSVLLAPDLSRLPPALVITASHDTLRSDGLRYAERLREAGVPVVQREFEGMPHAFLVMPRLCKESDEAIALISREISSALVD